MYQISEKSCSIVSSSLLRSPVNNHSESYILEYPFLVSNPCTDYFTSYLKDNIFVEHHYFNDFVYKCKHTDNIVQELYHSKYHPNYKWTNCKATLTYLSHYSHLHDVDMYVKHFECTQISSDFDIYCCDMPTRSPWCIFNNMFDKTWFDAEEDYFIFCKNRDIDLAFDPFKCVEATSGNLLKGLGASAYSAFQLATWRNNEEEISNILARWAIELLQLSLNFTPSNLILSFLKLLTHYIDVTTIIDHTFTLFSSTFEFLQRKFSQQPPSETVEATSLIIDLASLANVKDSVPALTASLAALAVVFATVIVGKDVDSSHRSKSMSERIAETMSCFAKFKSGSSAILSMIKEFSKYVYEIMFDLLGLESESHLVNLVRSVNIQDTADFKKEKIFEYCKYLSNPDNLLIIQSNKFQRDKLNFCFNVLCAIRFSLANDEVSISSVTNNYLVNLYNEMKKLREIVSKSMSTDLSRFCPFWVNLVGDSHTGKSTFTTILIRYLVKVLKEMEVREGINFELPTAEEELFFSVNFSDKYETNYRGQYFTIIDDFAQDANVPDINSGLKLINWCSNIPYATNQAAVTDKGIPFTSKIIVSTSNDMSLHNRKEIVSREALLNRICLSYKFKLDPNGDKFDWFKNKISIYKYDFITGQQGAKVDPLLIIRECAEKYMEWFKKEKKLDTIREVKSEVMETILNNMYGAVSPPNDEGFQNHPSNVQEVDLAQAPQTIGARENSLVELSTITNSQVFNSGPDVQPTSASIWCWLKLKPKIVNGLYYCDCEKHVNLNRAYLQWMGAQLVQNPNYMSDLIQEADESLTTEYNVDIWFQRQMGIRSQTIELEQQMSSAWLDIKEKLKSLVKSKIFQLVAGAAIALTTSAYFIGMRSNSSEEEENIIFETSKSYSITPKKRPPRPVRILNQVQPTCDEVEATFGFSNITDMFSNTISVNAMEIVSNSIIRNGNVCLLKSASRVNTGLRIEGTAILTNHHFLNTLRDGDKLKIEFCISDHQAQKFEQIFNKNRMFRIGDTDLAVYNCDHSVPNCRSIVKHFPMSDVRSQHRQALVVTADPMPIVFTNIVAKPNIHKSIYTVDGVSYDTLDSYETNCPAQKGMSGSILFSLSKMDQHKIIGIQTCRNVNGLNSNGYFKPVSQIDLRKALNSLNVDNFSHNIEKIVEETCLVRDADCPPNLLEGNLKYLGTVPKNKRIKSQALSKLEPSVIHDALSVTQLPSVLYDRDPRMKDELQGKSVIYRSVEGFSHPIGSIDTAVLEKAVDQLKVEYDVTLDVPGIHRRVLNLFETINGIPDVMLPLNMKTSPGYPYVLERKDTTKGGKYEWFEELTDLPAGYGKAYLPKTKLLSGLEQAEQQLLKGEMPTFVGYCCLKDETRPIARIEDGKTRAFICLPLHFNLLVRKYFGAFTSAMKKRAGIISSCVGIDPAKDWGSLFDKLMAKHSLWEDFDYSNWDQYLHPELVVRVADIINHWYDDGEINARARRILLYVLIHTVVIIKDKLFVKCQGQCSGCAITAELNCLIHDLLMVYVWMKYHKDLGLQTLLSDMRANVALCVYGDDLIMATDPDYKPEFTGLQIAPYMSELGMNITPGDKTSTVFTQKPPHEIFFLKRNFVRDGEMILAPLRSDIVENIIQWVHKSDNQIEATSENCRTALREGYMHRRKYFNKLSSDINNRIKIFNNYNNSLLMEPVVMDYDVLMNDYLCGSYMCAGLAENDLASYTET